MVPRKLTSNSNGNGSTTVYKAQKSDLAKKELLYENYYYDVTHWVKKHPGGGIINFYTESGEDATIAIQQFHQRSTKKVMSIMNSLSRRPATDSELNSTISPRHAALTADFMKLFKEFLDEGFFKPSITHVSLRILEILIFGFIGFYFVNSESIPLQIVGIVSLTFYSGRTSFFAHEGGHNSLTGNRRIDQFLQKSLWAAANGMAGSWWISQHSRHHAMPQRIHRDVDLDTLPLLAFNTKVVKDPKKGKNIFICYQAYLFLVIDTFIVATLWMFYLHPRYVFKRRLYFEIFFMGLHYLTPYYIGIPKYFIVIWLSSMYMFGTFTLSHSHLPVSNESLHWVEYSLLHTMNINPSIWCDWWMGYLNYQIEHHLFPTMPNFRQRQIGPRIAALAKRHNLPYQCMSYTDAVRKSFSNLQSVSEELSH